ncbi:MAG: TonB C-terminal domain-containing protein [Alphaproteobacteria bacterium]|nr:TonB C-terminal domain-containing protein [Alphaproteobacteria bacterium]
MAVTETFDSFDALEIVFGETRPAEAAPSHDERREPVLDSAPVFVEFGEPARLDPERIGLTWELPAAATRPIRVRSPIASLAAHFLLLLTIVAWPTTAPDIAAPIPVQLVFEDPPPPPAPAPKAAEPPPAQPQQGRLSSVDMGDVKPKELGPTTSDAPESAGDPHQSPSPPQAAEAPSPPPLPAPKPAPPKQKSAFQLPKPTGAAVPKREETPHEAPRAAQYAGPAATQDQYLAYLVTLTRQHMDLLPMSVIGDRRGETVVSVVVYADGTIGPLGVVHGSGYADIDRRIEAMIAAVRKFPPLPQWYRGNVVQLELTLRFPEALGR